MARKQKKSLPQRISIGYARAWQRPSIKILHLLVFAAVFMLLGHYLFPSNALTYPYVNGSLATTDFNRVNTYRTNHSWKTLGRVSCLDTIASHWAKKEATQNYIQDPSQSWMSSQLATYCPSYYWLSWGANDGESGGTGSTAESHIFNGFLNSCNHIINIADHGSPGVKFSVSMPAGGSCSSYSSAYNHIGVSAWVGSKNSGTLYVSQIFVRW